MWQDVRWYFLLLTAGLKTRKVLKTADTAIAGLFYGEQGLVGCSHQAVQVLGIVRKRRYAIDRLQMDHDPLAQDIGRIRQSGSDFISFLQCLALFPLRQDNDKLVPRIGYGISRWFQAIIDRTRNFLNGQIAVEVTMCVDDFLEMIQIHKYQGNRCIGGFRMFNICSERLEQKALIV